MKSTSLSGLPRARATPAAEVLQFAVLQVGSETYALDIMRIRGIINPVHITPVPKAPPFIEGVIELRGAILPLVDMRKRFDVPAGAASTRTTKYVLVNLGGHIVGLIVDAVTEVVRVPRPELRPAPSMAVGDAHRYFTAVFHHRGRLIMVIDVDAILTSTEKISLSGLAGDRPPDGSGGTKG